MTRDELIKEMARFLDKIPRNAGSYHVCDMLLGRAERIGAIIPTALECGDSGMMKVTELLDYSELDYEIKWEENEENDV